MKKRVVLLQYALLVLFFLNPVFLAGVWATDTYVWIGGFSNNWEDEENWRNMDDQVDGELPINDSDIMIDGNVTVYLSSHIITESIQLSGGAMLIVNVGGSITTTEGGLNGSNSIRLDAISPYPLIENPPGPNPLYLPYLTGNAPSSLIVHGTLNLDNDNARGSGLYIDGGSSVTVESAGSVFISNDGDDDQAIRVRGGGSLTNNGTIAITDPGPAGIKTTGGDQQYLIINNGTITITRGVVGFDLGDTYVRNNGTVIVTGTSGKIITGSGEFSNYGTVGGNGIVEADNDFILQPNCRIAPGTSVGTLNFEGDIDFSVGVFFDIEIEGPSSYDQIIVNGNATLTGATLNPIFTYAPLPGDMFSIITANSFSGSFSSPMQGQMITTGNTSFTASYTGSTGTAINFSVSDFLFPVELTAFTARPAGKAVQLAWITATETNNDYFAVEHSTDGRSFGEIGRVAGAGTSQEERRYAFTDYSPAAGLNYYRLRQNDFDGRYEYSDIRPVVFDKESSWTIYPTLAHESVTVEWVSAPGGDSIIEAFNLAGKKVYARKAPGQSATLQIPVQDWLPGQYWVLVRSGGDLAARQFVKE